MTKKLGFMATSKRIDLTTILVKHPDVAVHLGDQTDLNTFDQEHNILVHLHLSSVAVSWMHLAQMTYLPASYPHDVFKEHYGKAVSKLDILRHNNHVILLSYNIGLNALHTHATLWANKEASSHMREQAEQIIRHCGSLQWTHYRKKCFYSTLHLHPLPCLTWSYLNQLTFI